MKKKWKSGLSFVLAAALTAGGIGFVNPTVVWAEDVKELENTMEVFAVQPKDGEIVETTATYYIDAKNGNDSANGTSEATAWKSFANLKNYKFKEGAKVLLKAGCTWNGEKLEINNAEGTLENPVVLGKYGDGANPIINGQGNPWLTDRSNLNKEDVAVVHVKNSRHIIIENLEVTNWENDPADLMGETGDGVKFDQSKYMLTGILVENRDAGDLPGVIIRNNYVHDVNGYMSRNGSEGHKKGSGGIMALVTGGTTQSYYTDLKITGNKVEKVCHEAIYMESCWAARVLVGGAGSQQAGDKEWVGWPNVYVAHNYVNDVAGDGIVLINADGGVAEYNLVTKSASEEWDYSRNPAHAAIWMWDCNNVTMQHNEAAYTTSTQDGMAFDCDYGNQNVMYQYNYSHDNKGGFWMACPGPYYTVNSVVRYNISVNDGLFDGSRLMRVGEYGSIGHQVYNNTIYWDHKYNVNAVEQGSWGTPPTSGTDIYNNIFCGNTRSFVSNKGIHYENNCVWGGAQKAYPLDEDFSAVVADPGFVNVENLTDGSFTDGTVTIGSAEGMQLKQDSPCVDAGISHKAVPEESLPAVKDELVKTQITLENKDYKGNTVPYAGTAKVDIGAFEYQGEGTYVPPVAEADKTYLQALYSQAEGYKEENFVKSGWANLVTAMANAKKVLDNPSANQSTVDIVTAKLEDAMQNLDRVDKVQVGTPEDNVLLTYNASETKDNAGFEKTESDWGNWPSDVNREITEEQKHSGNKSLKVTKGSATDSFSEIGGIPVLPDTDYILEAWFYCPEGSDITKVGMEAKHHQSYTNGAGDIKLMNAKVEADAERDETGWYKFSQKFTTREYTKLSVALSSQTTTAYMDDVVLYPEKIIDNTEQLDKTKLEEALEIAPKQAESYYTPGSWKKFQDSKLAGRLKYSDAMAEQDQIDKAASDIQSAYDALTRKAQKRVLQLTYDSCVNRKQGNASDSAWSAFKKELKNTKAVLDDADVTQEKVDQQLQDLKNARNALVASSRNKKDQVIQYTKSFKKAYNDKAFNLKASVKTGNGALSYKTSDSKVATVDKNGKVTIKNIGKCTITITAASTSKYNAQTVKTTLTVNPKKVTLSSAKAAGGKKLKVQWKKDAKADGYEIQCSLKKDFKKIAAKATVKKAGTTKATIKKLTKGKKYYVRVCAYKNVKISGKSTTLRGAWSNVKLSAKVK
ncbi:MAG: hypothetical protein HFI74_08095 [Lachnospiraceae bacterium]|jgi:hypothetical protein|nr:hypothetical protein [Lachnospiraceae bacterium]